MQRVTVNGVSIEYSPDRPEGREVAKFIENVATELNTLTTEVVSVGAFGNTPDAKGATASAGVLTLQPADGTHPGALTASAQTIGGAKTFSAAISASNLSGTNTGNVTLAVVGSTPAAEGASIVGQVLTLQPADATHPGLVSTGAQTFAGAKTFSGGVISDTVTSATAATVVYVSTVANAGSNIAHKFAADVDLTGSTKIASFGDNNGTAYSEKAYILQEGTIQTVSEVVAGSNVRANGNISGDAITANGLLKSTTSDVECATAGKGLILKSPGGTRYRITVPDGGASLTITAI